MPAEHAAGDVDDLVQCGLHRLRHGGTLAGGLGPLLGGQNGGAGAGTDPGDDALDLTGIVLTKTDGDSRGGAALSVKQITGVPIKFAGTSEKMDGIELFDAETTPYWSEPRPDGKPRFSNYTHLARLAEWQGGRE